eukprot:COSAG04_NODE_1704_length_5882_cov_8.909217_8_plen_51_part_01
MDGEDPPAELADMMDCSKEVRRELRRLPTAERVAPVAGGAAQRAMAERAEV